MSGQRCWTEESQFSGPSGDSGTDTVQPQRASTLDGSKVSDVRALKSDNFEKLSHPIGDAVGARPNLSNSRAGPHEDMSS